MKVIRGLKIRGVSFDNKKRCFYILSAKGNLPLPYSKLRLVPTRTNKIKKAYADPECGLHAFTYILESGEEDTVPFDAVLEYNKDPEYVGDMLLYKLTCQAQDIIEKNKVNKREVMRRMKIFPSQFYRLINQAFYGKTIDQMLKLLWALDATIEVKVNNKKVA